MKYLFTFLLFSTFIFSQTKTWQQSSVADFSSGTLNNLTITNTNGGEIQLIQPLVRMKNDSLNSSLPQFVDYDDAGNYITGWVNNSRVYVQKFNAQNQPLTNPTIVDDSGGVFIRAYVNLALLNSGKFLVSWRATSPTLNFEVRYIQFFDAVGVKIDSNHRVFGIVDGTGSTPVLIADRDNERYIIVAPDLQGANSSNSYPLYGAIYSNNGINIHDSIKMVPVNGTLLQLNPSGAIRNGKLIFAWEGDNSNVGPGNIYAALYDSNCVPVTTPMMLAVNESSPSAALDENGNAYVTWVYNSGVLPGPPGQIFAQVLNSSGEKIGGVVQVTSLSEGEVAQPSLLFKGDTLRVKWTLSFSDGRSDQQWTSYWKLEQITDGYYTSPVFDAGNSQALFKSLSWNANNLNNTNTKFQLRSSSMPKGIQSSQWLGPTSGSDFYTNASGENINPFNNSNRYLQVKAYLHSSIVGSTPVLNDFSIKYTSADTIPPVSPSNFTAKGEHRAVLLSWISSPSPDVKCYHIYRAAGSDKLDTAYVTVDAGKNSFIDSSVSYKTQYHYGVTALDSALNESTMVISGLTAPNTMTVFVSTSGSPQCDGTADKPFSKINDAVAFSGEGDTVYVLTGEYGETITMKNGISLIGSSATATKIISSNTPYALTTGKNNLIKGFTFLVNTGIGCKGDSILITENIFQYQGSDYGTGIITGSYNNIVIIKNLITGFSMGIEANTSDFQSPGSTTVRNNIMRCGNGVRGTMINMTFINNTFIQEGSSGAAIMLIGGNAVIMNNCFAGYPAVNGYLTSFVILMNAVYSFDYNDRWNFNNERIDSVSADNISVDPQFKNLSKNDLHLSNTSGCKNKGNPSPDYNNIDGSRNDIGAYGGPDPLPDDLTLTLSTDISLNNVSGLPGDTVAVEVSLTNATGLQNARIEIQFDNSVMTFLNALPAPLIDGFTVKTVQYSGSTLILSLNGNKELTSGSGNIVALKFILNQIKESNKRSPVEFGTVSLSDSGNNKILISSLTNGSCIVLTNSQYPHNIFVDASNNGIKDGSIQHPYSTIQDGINNAQPGDTVKVAAGNYTGPVSMRSKIFITGLGANATSIECPDDPLSMNPVVVFNNVDSSGITGFALINNNQRGSVINLKSSNAFISNNKIDQPAMTLNPAVTVDSYSKVVIRDNYFCRSQADGGGQMLNIFTDNAIISKNIFSDTSGFENLVVSSCKNVVITNNCFYLSQAGRGLLGNNTRNIIVANNLFVGGSMGGFGLKFMDADSNIVVNNIFDSGMTGIDENNGAQQIFNNIFTGNAIALSIGATTIHQYNILWNNKLNFGSGRIDSTEIAANPQFINQEEGNYNLLKTSPAKNSGNPGRQWNNKDGTRNEIGLYGGPYADSSMFAQINSKITIGNVSASPGDTVIVPIYAIGIAGISGIQILLSYDSDTLSLLETHTTAYSRDFVLSSKNIGSSNVQLNLDGYQSISIDSGAILEMKFIVNKNAKGNIPLSFQDIKFNSLNSRVLQGMSYVNGEILLQPNSVRTDNSNLPKEFALYQNYPNPFNPTTNIKYSIPASGYISLKVYNILGQEVITLFKGYVKPGNYVTTFNGSRFSSGVYIYQLRAQNFVKAKKLVLLK